MKEPQKPFRFYANSSRIPPSWSIAYPTQSLTRYSCLLRSLLGRMRHDGCVRSPRNSCLQVGRYFRSNWDCKATALFMLVIENWANSKRSPFQCTMDSLALSLSRKHVMFIKLNIKFIKLIGLINIAAII